MMALVLATSLSAQTAAQNRTQTNRDRQAWVDFRLVQHLGLNSWNDAAYARVGLPAPSITEVRGSFNFIMFEYIFRQPVLHGFIDMGLGVMPAAEMKTFDLNQMPMPHSGTKYYLREMLSEEGTGEAGAHFRMTAGLSADIRTSDRLTVMPAVGIGLLTMQRRSYSIILKEDGTNMQYRTTYTWGAASGDEYDYGATSPGFVTGRLNFRYRMKSQASLLFGIEYTRLLDTLDFHARYTNTFNGNIQRSVSATGNKVNMVGLSVGVSFR